jgi:hypothetical protein
MTATVLSPAAGTLSGNPFDDVIVVFSIPRGDTEHPDAAAVWVNAWISQGAGQLGSSSRIAR